MFYVQIFYVQMIYNWRFVCNPGLLAVLAEQEIYKLLQQLVFPLLIDEGQET